MEQREMKIPMSGKKKMSEAKKKEFMFLCCMMALPVIQWLVFWLFTNASTIALAFQDGKTGVFTFDNFSLFWEELTASYGRIGEAVQNTFIYFLTSLCIIMPGGLVIAYFLYKRILFYKGFRVIFYFPAIISPVAMVAVYSNFVQADGPLEKIVNLFGGTLPDRSLLARPETATTMIVIYCIWTGFCTNILLFSGAMVRIPIEILESAKLEGCGTLRELVQIILPLIWPTLSTQIILVFTGLFTASGPIKLFTNGAFETMTIAHWIFLQVYGTGRIGGTGSYNLVSATGLCFTIVGVPIILFIRWLMDKIPSVEY